MTYNNLKPASIAAQFTILFSVVVALIIPLSYFVISYEHLKGTMETEAEINSELVSRLISTNPDLWRYETIRVEELLARRPRSGTAETRRIFDEKNTLVAESVNPLQAPRISASHDVGDSGIVVGRIEINRSLFPILLKTGIAAFFGLCFGLFLYRWLPFREVVKTGHQLQDANDFLRKVMEGSTNSLVVLDITGHITMFNGRFEALSGRSREELMGLPFCRLFTGDSLSRINSELYNMTTEHNKNVTFETLISRPDGLDLNLFCGAVPLFTEGTISGVVVSLDDITERLNAEDQRLQLERQLQHAQKLESLGVLAGGIAHDFNNILTIILGYCNVIKDDADSAPEQAEYVQRIEDAANRAGDLCRQMLTYAGKNELQHSPINMSMMVDEMVKMLHSGIKNNVTVELNLRDELVVIADNSQIQQVIMNLVINAAEAIGDLNGTVIISLSKVDIFEDQTEKDYSNTPISVGSYICLEVTDNGCGMDKETRNRIFEPFFTTKFTGRGLGISSTLGIVKSHNGALQLSSTPGEGSTFKIYLPLPEIPVEAKNKPAACNTPDARLGSGTILLVDDEEELRTIGPIRLKQIGYSTLTATNGREALEIYREHAEKIDLVLLDVLMPELGGVETYYQLREISTTIPIVFCSGCSQKELSSDILNDEHTDFLRKPYDTDQLRTILLHMI